MLDRTTTAASERSAGRTDVASVSGPGVMLTGVVLERLPRWATEDAGKGQRLPRLTRAGRWLLLGAAARPGRLLRLAVALPARLRRVPRRQRDAGAEVHQRPRADPLHQRVHRLVRRAASTRFTIWLKDTITEWVINPLQDLTGRLAVVGDGARAARRRLRARRLAPGRDHAGLRGGHLLDRPVERHDGHPRDDADRHRAGDADRGGPRGGHGPQPTRRPGDPAVPGRLPDDPAVRLPGPGAGAVRARAGSPRSSRRSPTPYRSRPSWSPTGSAASRRRRSRRRGPPAAPPGR